MKTECPAFLRKSEIPRTLGKNIEMLLKICFHKHKLISSFFLYSVTVRPIARVRIQYIGYVLDRDVIVLHEPCPVHLIFIEANDALATKFYLDKYKAEDE